jgi:hypothetical protein
MKMNNDFMAGVSSRVLRNDRVNTHLPRHVFRPYADLDGTNARKFLESAGFEVIENHDNGLYGQATTADGYRLSTNGYFCRLNDRSFISNRIEGAVEWGG